MDAFTARTPTGSTDDSDVDTTGLHPIPSFTHSDKWLREYQEAAAGENRPKLRSEIPDHITATITSYDHPTKLKFREFQDIMYQCLAKLYVTKKQIEALHQSRPISSP